MPDPGHIADVNTTDESLPLEEEDEDVDADDRNRDPDYEVTPADTASEDEELVATEREEPQENEGQERVASEGGNLLEKRKRPPYQGNLQFGRFAEHRARRHVLR